MRMRTQARTSGRKFPKRSPCSPGEHPSGYPRRHGDRRPVAHLLRRHSLRLAHELQVGPISSRAYEERGESYECGDRGRPHQTFGRTASLHRTTRRGQERRQGDAQSRGDREQAPGRRAAPAAVAARAPPTAPRSDRPPARRSPRRSPGQTRARRRGWSCPAKRRRSRRRRPIPATARTPSSHASACPRGMRRTLPPSAIAAPRRQLSDRTQAPAMRALTPEAKVSTDDMAPACRAEKPSLSTAPSVSSGRMLYTLPPSTTSAKPTAATASARCGARTSIGTASCNGDLKDL